MRSVFGVGIAARMNPPARVLHCARLRGHAELLQNVPAEAGTVPYQSPAVQRRGAPALCITVKAK